MKNPFKSISVEGFKSIRDLRNFPLNPGLNVLIGANGAGKSNFIELFKILDTISFGSFDTYVIRMGGAETFLFQGSGVTQRITLRITFDPEITCRFDLVPTVDAKLLLRRTVKASQEIPENFNFIKDWQVYHFHNTSDHSPLRRASSVHDHDTYYSDGSNLAAFLWGLKRNHTRIFEKIETSVRQILPAFANFDLTPVQDESQPDNQLVWLYWRQKGYEYRYKPWQFSDGTLRFIALATALLQPAPPVTIVIDEPELGLHPSALNLLTGFMHEAAFQTQLILTTQSPDLLNTMEPEDVITVNMGSNGESIFQRLDRADLGGWLEEYTLGDLWWKNVIHAGPDYA